MILIGADGKILSEGESSLISDADLRTESRIARILAARIIIFTA